MIKKEYALSLILFSFLLSSCSVVSGIFKAGMWWGIFLVLGFVALLLYLITRGKR
ncbi:hypothetical protein [Filimonas effusa]|uniref:hypothetical protein n=1 Tax=Filimonas effusa TaxID=2508721 RepID=UPI0013E922E0|nr:hypothetical protein [Filimonas effusa]